MKDEISKLKRIASDLQVSFATRQMNENINMTMNGGQIRFYLRIYCRTLGILWYM
jgi:hypothetical protein